MKFLDYAGYIYIQRGYKYFLESRVYSVDKSGKDEYCAIVQGTREDPYRVSLNLKHPLKSTCSCPFAKGRKILCKHIIATYYHLTEDKYIKDEPEEIKDDINPYAAYIEDKNKDILDEIEDVYF